MSDTLRDEEFKIMDDGRADDRMRLTCRTDIHLIKGELELIQASMESGGVHWDKLYVVLEEIYKKIDLDELIKE